MNNLNLILPEIFISLSIMFLLVLGVFKKNSSKLIYNISLIFLLVGAVITFNETMGINKVKLFNNSVIIDYLSSLMKIITLFAAFLAF
jgi:NADH-quinone oxidoreductase subunit N